MNSRLQNHFDGWNTIFFRTQKSEIYPHIKSGLTGRKVIFANRRCRTHRQWCRTLQGSGSIRPFLWREPWFLFQPARWEQDRTNCINNRLFFGNRLFLCIFKPAMRSSEYPADKEPDVRTIASVRIISFHSQLQYATSNTLIWYFIKI
jgi:hypothetical protein